MSRTAKQLASGQRRSLAAINNKLLALEIEWDEVDQFLMGELADARERIARIIEAMKEVGE